MKKLWFVITFVGVGLLSHQATPHSHQQCLGFLPDNDLHITMSAKLTAFGTNESQYNQVLDQVERVYAPIVRSKGAQLVVRRLWSNSEVNARAFREGSSFVVEMYGGLARHPSTTPDALALVACHEIGHHIGGTPKYSDRGGEWASVEGQSDYFASLKCLRKVWANDNNVVNNPDPTAVQKCDESFSNAQDRQICLRAAMAGIASAGIFQSLDGRSTPPKLGSTDPSVVSRTFESHPKPQCRLDTYFSGSLCPVDENTDVSNRDANQGVCARVNNQESGARPLCWYKPSGGNTNPPPVGGVAAKPALNGRDSLRLRDPRQSVRIDFDVSNFSGVGGAYVEVSKPNQGFSNPNGTQPDRQSLGGVAVAGARGSFTLVPSRHLPGWGAYQVRIFPLDQRGQRAVGKASNSSVLNLAP